ncbi:MAG: SH3 domain-containing protein [Myxococcales bacterium]|nr:SH3 domain-containing protein [Myxococcales bacterium]
MANRKETTRVEVPAAGTDRPAWSRVGIFAAVGLVLGIAWPSLARVRIGPHVPGAKKEAAEAAPSTTPTAAPAPSAAPAAPALVKTAAPAAKVLSEQLVVVSGGAVKHCFEGRDRHEGEDCGKIATDRLLAPRLEQLKGCPSALGLQGSMQIGFDLDFTKKEIAVRRGEDSEIPGSTVNGIMACLADYISDVSAEKIPHKHTKYRVVYDLKFYPPGTAVPRSGQAEDAPDDSDEERGVASVSWDTALIRDEPRTGKVIARLVKGTRVKILGRRDDWYRVKMRSKEGWLYRGALGL